MCCNMQNAMKIRFIILMLAIVGCFTSCYDDKSNNSVKTINPLVIDMGGVPTSMSAFLLDTLEIKPVVYKIGSDDADLSYKWEISGNDIMPFVLDSTMTLKAVVSVAPNSNPYTIILTVTITGRICRITNSSLCLCIVIWEKDWLLLTRGTG